MPRKRSPYELVRLARLVNELKFLVEYVKYLEKTKNQLVEVPLIDVNYDLHTQTAVTVIPKPTLGQRRRGILSSLSIQLARVPMYVNPITSKAGEKLALLFGVPVCIISCLYNDQYAININPIPLREALEAYASKLISVGIKAEVRSSSVSDLLTFNGSLEAILAIEIETKKNEYTRKTH